jgi:ribonuclease P protein component
VTPSLLGFTRVGVIVPRYGRSAVDRNRLKRRLREVVRREWLPAWRARAPLDVVVRMLPPAYGRDGASLRRELAQLADRIDRQRETPA